MRDRGRTFDFARDVDLSDLGMVTPSVRLPADRGIAELRRGRPRLDPVHVLSVIRSGNVLLARPEASLLAGRRGRRGIGGVPHGEILQQYRYEALGQNQITSFLEGLDRRLTPNQGLRALNTRGKLVTVQRPSAKGKVLLLIHGTFSNNEHFVGEFKATEFGRKFLERAGEKYDQVLAFDHPTLSVSPMLNALDLARLFQEPPAELDVIAHSRGGLVTRWWFEAFAPRPLGTRRRAVLVGSPLGGTSLASPACLRSSLELLLNIGHGLEAVSEVAAAGMPLIVGALGLLKVMDSILSVAAHTPIVDAVLAMIPGLQAQSRVGNNAELDRLNASSSDSCATYAVVRANFEPEKVGWRFWEWLREWKMRSADAVVDQVFPGANDLVVDTDSMNTLPSPVTEGSLRDFGATGTVHHLNYFRQKETVEFIEQRLAWA